MKKTRSIAFRRKREGKTNYKKRIRLLMSKTHRMVVRISLKNVVAQIIEFHPEGDKVLATASSKELLKKGWKLHGGNLVTGYLVGYLLGSKSKVKKAVLDIGLQTCVSGCCIYAVLKGALDAGLKISHSEDILPKEDRINGKHISEYATKLKDNKVAFEKQFSKLLKQGIDPLKMNSYFEEMKKKLGAKND